MRNIKLVLLAINIVGLSFISGGQHDDSIKFKELDNVINHEMKISAAPGVVIGVVKNGQIIFQKGYGICNTNTQVPITDSTIFHIASITKSFTAAAILTACENNDIDINTPIGNILSSLSPKISQITIHQLLSQNSGIMEYWPNDNECKNDLLEYFVKAGDNALFVEPGQVFSYSNNGYALAGLLLAELHKSNFKKAIQDLVLEPIGMTNTTFELGEVTTKSFATGHMSGKTVPPGLTDIRYQASAGLYTNVTDLAKFATCLMNNGTINSKQIFSKEVVKKMKGEYQPFGVQHQYLSYPESYYGYGLINYKYKGVQFFGHSGEAGSQNALFAMAPKHNTAIMIFSNTGYYPFIRSLEKAKDIFIPTVEESVSKFIIDAAHEKLIGKYYKPDLMNSKKRWIEIVFQNEKLHIVFSDGRTFELSQFAKERFKFIDPNVKFQPEIGFFPDQSGKIKYLNFFWRAYIKE